jgi:hypothetical protein
MPEISRRAPLWFWVIAILLTLWGAVGCYACFMQINYGPEAMERVTKYDRALYASLPVWYNYCYALAVGAGLLGGASLLIRSAWAGLAFFVSLIAAVVQFGYLFAATDIILAKGAATVLPFPIFIVVVAVLSVWFAVYAYRQNWTG